MIERLKRKRVQLAIGHAVIGAAGTAWQFYTAGGALWLPLGIFIAATVIGIREGLPSRKGAPRGEQE